MTLLLARNHNASMFTRYEMIGKTKELIQSRTKLETWKRLVKNGGSCFKTKRDAVHRPFLPQNYCQRVSGGQNLQ